jgi:hypothetical protein
VTRYPVSGLHCVRAMRLPALAPVLFLFVTTACHEGLEVPTDAGSSDAASCSAGSYPVKCGDVVVGCCPAGAPCHPLCVDAAVPTECPVGQYLVLRPRESERVVFEDATGI